MNVNEYKLCEFCTISPTIVSSSADFLQVAPRQLIGVFIACEQALQNEALFSLPPPPPRFGSLVRRLGFLFTINLN